MNKSYARNIYIYNSEIDRISVNVEVKNFINCTKFTWLKIFETFDSSSINMVLFQEIVIC